MIQARVVNLLPPGLMAVAKTVSPHVSQFFTPLLVMEIDSTERTWVLGARLSLISSVHSVLRVSVFGIVGTFTRVKNP